MSAPTDASEWRPVEWSFPVVGSTAFYSDKEARFNPAEAFEALVVALRGEVKGPDDNGDFTVRVYDRGDYITVTLSAVVMAQSLVALGMTDDRRALFLAASVLRSPKAAYRERMAQLEHAARLLLPLIALPRTHAEQVPDSRPCDGIK